MPYTREMFVKEHYPEHYEKFLLGQQEGLKKGLEKGLQKGMQKGLQKGFTDGEIVGELIGKIQLLQKFLNKPVAEKTILKTKGIDALQTMYVTLENEWEQTQSRS